MPTEKSEELACAHLRPVGSERYAIVMACDRGYAMPLATALRSLVEANSRTAPLNILILNSDFPESLRRKVALSLPPHSAHLNWRSVETARFKGFSTRPYISQITYARLLLPELVPAGISRALYIDADVLVLNDLEELWQTDLEGAILAAVPDTDGVAHSARLWPGKGVAQGEIHQRPFPYFNAGVLLIDIHRWRQERVSQRAMEYMERNSDTLMADQDALNFACLGLWKELASRWNFQDHDLENSIQVLAGGLPGIVHFAGKWKPWSPSSLSPDAALYESFRRNTAFARPLVSRIAEGFVRAYVQLRRRLRKFNFLQAFFNRPYPPGISK